MIEMALKLEIVWWLNAVTPFIGNVQLSNIMLRNQQAYLYKTSFCIKYHINKKNNNFIMRVSGLKSKITREQW